MEETKGETGEREENKAPRRLHGWLPTFAKAIARASGSTLSLPAPPPPTHTHTLNSQVRAPKADKVGRDQGDNKAPDC